MHLSIAIPIYNEVDNIDALLDEIQHALSNVSYDYEVVLVDDGSTDGSRERLVSRAEKQENLIVVLLRRNSGQTAALQAAIDHSSGDIIVPMDGDLQNDPNDIPKLLNTLMEGYDVVSGWRKDRQDFFLSRRLPSVLANALISKITGVKLHDFGCSLKAYKREILSDVRLYGETHRFIPIFAFLEGARITEQVVNHRARQYGVSKYGIGRTVRVLLDLLLLLFLSKSLDRPIQFFGKIGLVFIGLSLLSFVYMILLRVIWGTSFILTPLPILTTTFGLSGIMFVLMGIIADIQSRTYYEAQKKTHYRVHTVINLRKKKAE